MRRWLRRTILGTLALAGTSLQGCSLGWFTISIPDFASKSVGGVWLWHLSAETGLWERDTQIAFGAPSLQADGEWLTYQAAPLDGSPTFPGWSQVVRSANNPDQVTLQLLFSRAEAAGTYRASTYNDAGDSPLSNESVAL